MQKIIDKIKCIWSKMFNTLDLNKDGIIDAKDFTYLEKKTKDELEELGRKLGSVTLSQKLMRRMVNQ